MDKTKISKKNGSAANTDTQLNFATEGTEVDWESSWL